MRLLVSFVNSPLALAGFDWERGELFWSLSSDVFRACGMCYHGEELLVSSDDAVLRLGPAGGIRIPLPGPHPALAHSVHALDEERFCVVDTGNSALRVYDRAGRLAASYAPAAAWPQLPPDALHLNDFAVTPQGLIGSAFDWRPWRAAQRDVGWEAWRQGSYGVLLQLTPAAGGGRIVGCGLDHPHSLQWREERLYVCCSATGAFQRWRWDAAARLLPDASWTITSTHFLRGACPAGTEGGEAQAWYLGGSTSRHGEPLSPRIAIYRFDAATGQVAARELPLGGEIYDLLPWRDDVLEPFVQQLPRR